MFIIGDDYLINYITDKYFSCYIEKPKYYYKFDENKKINSIIMKDNINVEIKGDLAYYKYDYKKEEEYKKIKIEEFNIENIKTLIINKQLNNYEWIKHFKNVEYIFINKCDINLEILNELKNIKTLCLSNCKNIILPKNINPIRLCLTNCNELIIPNTYTNLKILDISEKSYNLPNYLSSIEELYYFVEELKNIPKEYINLKKINILSNNKYSLIDIFNYIKDLNKTFNIKEINIFNCICEEKEFKDNINMIFIKDKIINFYSSFPNEKLINNSIKLYYNKDYNISYFGTNIFTEILMNEGLF